MRSHVAMVKDEEGVVHMASREILDIFTRALEIKLQEHRIDGTAMERMLAHVKKEIPPGEQDALYLPFTDVELHNAVMSGKKWKAPGSDGISNDLFRSAWNIIRVDLLELLNAMYLDGPVAPAQIKGIVVYVPKLANPVMVTDYRSITLLNSDIKLYARLIANRLKPILEEVLHPGQFCGVRNNTILDAIAVIRDTLAETELTNEPLCVLSLDFKDAFDRVAHEYLYGVLKHYGVTDWLVERIRALYDTATSQAQLNGFLSKSVPLQRSVRQGCPLSMLLFNVCLDPFLRSIEEKIRPARPP